MPVRKLLDLVDIACHKGRKKMVVAAAEDADLMVALYKAERTGIVTPILVGNRSKIRTIAAHTDIDLSNMEILDEPDVVKACAKSVRIAKEGDAEIIMKGHVGTSILLKQILDKKNGLVKDNLLSHIAFFETEFYHKLLGITDAALNIAPGLEEKVEIIKNAVSVCGRLGINIPKIGILAAVETINEKMEATVHAAKLKNMNQQDLITDCIVDGPFALDNAVSTDAAINKGIISKVAGDADVLLVPDINSGNILYKSLSILGGATGAAVVTGAGTPVVLTSRADNDKIKFFSIALAAALL